MKTGVAVADRAGADEGRDTGRLEAFSDGVFAIAVTLLVLELRAPLPTALHEGERFWDSLLHEWPAYLAFATSFATILIMWVNHHNLFALIPAAVRASGSRMYSASTCVGKGMMVTVARSRPLRSRKAWSVRRIYAATFLAMALAFNRLWAYAQRDGRLLARNVDPALIGAINAQFRLGPLTYVIALVIAALQPLVGFVVIMALVVYWALPEGLRPGPGHEESGVGSRES